MVFTFLSDWKKKKNISWHVKKLYEIRILLYMKFYWNTVIIHLSLLLMVASALQQRAE